MSRMIGPATALYRRLLRLLPERFDEDDRAAMAELFAWQAERRAGWRGRASYLVGALADVTGQVLRERGPGWIGRTSRRERRGSSGILPGPRSHPMEAVLFELRGAVRNLVRRPRLTLPLLITLALGIGLATAMTSVVRSVLLAPLPYPEGDELVRVRERTESGSLVAASWANFSDWRDRSGSLLAMAAVVGPMHRSAAGGSEPARVPTLFVSADYFRVAGVEPLSGRSFRGGENVPGGPAAAVVSHGFWQRTLAGQLGGTIIVQDLLGANEAWEVVGVMPPDFDLMGAADIYLPLERGVPWTVRGNHVVSVIGRVPPDRPILAVETALSGIQRQVYDEHAGETEAVGVGVSRLRDELVEPLRTPVLLLLVGAALLLLTAFLNTAGALLASGVRRRSELHVRASLGATRARLQASLLVESVLLAGGAAVAGAGVSRFVLLTLNRLAPGGIPRLRAIDPDAGALIATAIVLSLPGILLFGLGGALLTIRRTDTSALRLRGGGSTRGQRRVWQVLIAAEVALALMLLATAGVLGRSLWRIANAETGFTSDDVLTAQVSPPALDYPTPADLARYGDAAVEALRSLPGVDGAGIASMLPIPSPSSIVGPVTLESGDTPDAVFDYRVADRGYFETLGVRLLEGRLFDERDGPGAPHAAVVDATLAERLWPGTSAIGRRFHLGGMDPYRADWLTVVGVVAEARAWSVPAGSRPTYYVHARQRPAFLQLTGIEIVVHGRATSAASVRQTLATLDPDVPIRMATLEDRLAAGTADRRFVLILLATFAGLSLLLCAVGVWGVVSFVVSRGMRDMGIRIALGARHGQVLHRLQRQTLVPVVVGCAVGVFLAAGLIRTVRSLLFGVGVFDLPSLLAVSVTLLVTAWVASWIPAQRIRRLDPAHTLRMD